MLEVVSFARIERWILWAARIRVSRPPLDEVAAAWVDRILWRLPPPWKNTCLRRASVLFYLLRSAGRPVELCIGVRRNEHGELLAHAWLLKDGVLHLEPLAERNFIGEFQEIARFPEPS